MTPSPAACAEDGIEPLANPTANPTANPFTGLIFSHREAKSEGGRFGHTHFGHDEFAECSSASPSLRNPRTGNDALPLQTAEKIRQISPGNRMDSDAGTWK